MSRDVPSRVSTGRVQPASAEGQDALREHHERLTAQARGQHDALSAAIETLERALAESASDRERDWASLVVEALERVRAFMRAHAEGVEEPEGLFDEVAAVEPRLAPRVQSLREEHASFANRASALADELAEQTVNVAGLRGRTGALLDDLRTHRAAEAELVYQAFWIELGAGD